MNRIRDLREDIDLRQLDVSIATGIDQRTLSNYETEKTNPDSYAILKLADFFDVSADYLLGRSNSKTPSVETLMKKLQCIQNELSQLCEELKQLQ